MEKARISKHERSSVIGVSRRGEQEPSLYQVSDEVVSILTKMLQSNHRMISLGAPGLFTFEEVAFLLRILGVERSPTDPSWTDRVRQWISED